MVLTLLIFAPCIFPTFDMCTYCNAFPCQIAMKNLSSPGNVLRRYRRIILFDHTTRTLYFRNYFFNIYIVTCEQST